MWDNENFRLEEWNNLREFCEATVARGIERALKMEDDEIDVNQDSLLLVGRHSLCVFELKEVGLRHENKRNPSIYSGHWCNNF